MKNRLVFYVSNSLLALIIGAVIYCVFRPDTYVSRLVYSILHINVWTNTVGGNIAVQVTKNYIPDMLWAYALTFCVCVILGNDKKSIGIGLAIAIMFCVFVEYSQKINIILGTFDWLDILLEIISCILSYVIILNYERKNKNEKKSG